MKLIFLISTSVCSVDSTSLSFYIGEKKSDRVVVVVRCVGGYGLFFQQFVAERGIDWEIDQSVPGAYA